MKALVITEDALTQTTVSRALRRRGFSLVPCPSGREALQRRAAEVDLVVIDHAPPANDGPALWQTLRRPPAPAASYFLVLTADDDPVAAEAYRDTSTTRLLSKPIDPTALDRQLRAIAIEARSPGSASPHFTEIDYRALVEQAPVVTYVNLASDAVTPLYVCSRVDEILGVTPAEWMENPHAFWDSIHPDDVDRVRAEHLTLGTSTEPFRIQYRLVRPDGQVLWVHDEMVFVPSETDEYGMWYGTLSVVSVDKMTEDAFSTSAERLRLAIDGAALGTWEWTIPDEVLHISSTFATLLGLPSQTKTLPRADLQALLHPDDRASLSEAMRRSLESNLDFESTVRVVWPDGSMHWVEARGRAQQRDAEGRVITVTGVALDMTSAKEAEATSRQNEHRYRELFATLRRQTEEIALLDEVRTALARELDLPTVMRIVTEAIASRFGYALVGIYRIEGSHLELAQQVGYDDDFHAQPISCGVMGRVARTGQPALVTNSDGDVDYVNSLEGTVSEVCVPLYDEGRLVGVLNVERTEQPPLDENDLRLMLALSEHIEIAMGRARLFAQVQETETRFRQAFDSAPIGMALVNLEGRWVRVNHVLCAILGYSEDELLKLTFQDVTHPDDLDRDLEHVQRLLAGEADSYTMEKRYIHPSGRLIWSQLSVSLMRADDGTPRYFISQIEDITDRKLLAARLEHQALHDPLTMLPNRVLFLKRLDHALSQQTDRNDLIAVFYLDLDGFKTVNDSLGHEWGDHLLETVGQRLASSIRPNDTLARFGGDEFAVLVKGLADETAAMSTADRLLNAMHAPFVLDGHEVFIGISIGIALAQSPSTKPRELLRQADIALYQAKAAGRGTAVIFEAPMAVAVVSKRKREHELRRAIDSGELRLVYQPTVNLTTGAVIGFEALVRWEDPDQGLLEPASFIQLAEDSGLIWSLGRWVLAEACRQAEVWRQLCPETAPLVMGVNLSARQFRPAIEREIVAALAATGMAPDRLELEFNERGVVDYAATSIQINALRELGVRIAIDDFGTGYSALSYLRRLVVDTIKIDRGFVLGLEGDAASQAIVRAVTALAHELGIAVTAEGIETQAQLDQLRQLGVDRGQGFFLSRPVPGDLITQSFALRAQAPANARPPLTLSNFDLATDPQALEEQPLVR